MSEHTPEIFNPYEFLKRVEAGKVGEDRVFLSDQFRATDLATMLKTALIAVEILSEKLEEVVSARSKGAE